MFHTAVMRSPMQALQRRRWAVLPEIAIVVFHTVYAFVFVVWRSNGRCLQRAYERS